LLYSEFGAQAAATPTLTVANNAIIGGELHGPANFIIDPAVIGANTGTVEIKGNLTVQGTTTTINSTVVDLDTLSLGDNEKISLGAGGVGDNGGAVESDLEIYSDGTNAYFDSGFIASSASPNIYFRTSASTTLDTNALTILNSGNVGIGQSTPTRKLEVGGGAVSFSPDVAGKHTHEFTTNAANDARYFLRSDTTTKVDIQANGASYFNGGNVGINVTNPDLTLHVNGVNALPSSSGSTATGHLTLRAKASSSSHGMFMGVSNAAPWSSWIQAQDASNNATNYPLLLNPNGGNVGIGQNSPGSRLDVNGLTKSGGFQANGNVTPTAGHGVEIFAPSSSQGMIQAFDRTGGSQMELKFRGSDITFFGTSSTDERVRITGAGLVGIGIVNPVAKLQVNGTSNGLQARFGGNGTGLGISCFQKTNNNAGVIIEAQDATHGTLTFKTAGGERLRIDSDGHVTPGADDTQDLGSTSKRWRNIYTGDLQLSNKGSSNEVDGTWGNYTIQEGEEELFIINRRSGKKFKFVLEEVK
jgi:hypothetical protein